MSFLQTTRLPGTHLRSLELSRHLAVGRQTMRRCTRPHVQKSTPPHIHTSPCPQTHTCTTACVQIHACIYARMIHTLYACTRARRRARARVSVRKHVLASQARHVRMPEGRMPGRRERCRGGPRTSPALSEGSRRARPRNAAAEKTSSMDAQLLDLQRSPPPPIPQQMIVTLVHERANHPSAYT